MASPPPQPYNPTSLPLPHPEAYPGEPREYARALMQRKDEIEAETQSMKDILASHNAGPSTPLVDPEGYPRGDIDIYSIRHTRAALARLNTDHREVTERLASALEAAFAPSSSANTSSSHSLPNGSRLPIGNALPNGHSSSARDLIEDPWPERAIARVNSVAADSPASQAGLSVGDVIYSFGEVTCSTSGGLQAIGSLVSRSEGISLNIRVLRGSERFELALTPRNGWGGRGSLGCHILPI